MKRQIGASLLASGVIALGSAEHAAANPLPTVRGVSGTPVVSQDFGPFDPITVWRRILELSNSTNVPVKKDRIEEILQVKLIRVLGSVVIIGPQWYQVKSDSAWFGLIFLQDGLPNERDHSRIGIDIGPPDHLWLGQPPIVCIHFSDIKAELASSGWKLSYTQQKKEGILSFNYVKDGSGEITLNFEYVSHCLRDIIITSSRTNFTRAMSGQYRPIPSP